jgi:hypothetical protein
MEEAGLQVLGYLQQQPPAEQESLLSGTGASGTVYVCACVQPRRALGRVT